MNCKYYDAEIGWCKRTLDLSESMPHVEYCPGKPCSHYQRKANKIIINPKYNVGDKVWFTYCFYDKFYPCQNGGTITEIDIRVTENKTNVSYILSIEYGDGVGFESYTENMCFGSYEDCAEWCQKHNSN
jgi:hypothetical protein